MIYLRMYSTVSGRWPQAEETADQKHMKQENGSRVSLKFQ
jgi:hypothetical protein